MTSFPKPKRFSPGSTRWRLSNLEAYEAAINGEPEPPKRDAERERYLDAKQVARRYDSSVPTIWRWSRESERASEA